MSILPTSPRRLAFACTAIAAAGMFAFAAQQSPRRANMTGMTPVARATTAMHAMPRDGDARLEKVFRSIVAAALDPSAAGADPFTVEPRLPRAAGTPCVIEIATNVQFGPEAEQEPFEYNPPTDCPGPWSKAKLVMEMTGPRPNGEPNANLRLVSYGLASGEGNGGGMLFMGAPQEHGLLSSWHLERDVTEISSIFRHRQFFYALSDGDLAQSYDPVFSEITARSIKLVVFPATAQTPAPRIADVVVGTTHPAVGYPLALQLPRNIERAYLDVYVQVAEGLARPWYTCVPTEDADRWPSLRNGFAMGGARSLEADPDQGCTAATHGSYREVEVYVDQSLAGLAPVFPWLPSNIQNTTRNTVDDPAPSVQALNMLPFRVDLTPFAAQLNDGQQHTVSIRQAPWGGPIVSGQLLLYLDHGRGLVSGAVTRNTLAGQPSVPVLTDGLAQSGNTVSGRIETRLVRSFVIEGYVDTSHGRVHSRVAQTNHFDNVQTLSVTGLPTAQIPDGGRSATDYMQKVRLTSTVDQVSQRTRGTTLLSDDRLYVTYPLLVDFHFSGDRARLEGLPFVLGRDFAFSVHQARAIRASHGRLGMARYSTRLGDIFDASHEWHYAEDTGRVTHFNWDSARRYRFTDSLGSCYSADLTTLSGVLQTRTRGTDCPNGRNAIRWFAHPDGSPDAIGWGTQPQ